MMIFLKIAFFAMICARLSNASEIVIVEKENKSSSAGSKILQGTGFWTGDDFYDFSLKHFRLNAHQILRNTQNAKSDIPQEMLDVVRSKPFWTMDTLGDQSFENGTYNEGQAASHVMTFPSACINALMQRNDEGKEVKQRDQENWLDLGCANGKETLKMSLGLSQGKITGLEMYRGSSGDQAFRDGLVKLSQRRRDVALSFQIQDALTFGRTTKETFSLISAFFFLHMMSPFDAKGIIHTVLPRILRKGGHFVGTVLAPFTLSKGYMPLSDDPRYNVQGYYDQRKKAGAPFSGVIGVRQYYTCDPNTKRIKNFITAIPYDVPMNKDGSLKSGKVRVHENNQFLTIDKLPSFITQNFSLGEDYLVRSMEAPVVFYDFEMIQWLFEGSGLDYVVFPLDKRGEYWSPLIKHSQWGVVAAKK